jgi:hypothetical protein
MKYHAVIAYSGPEVEQIQVDYIGTFNSEEKAEQAIEEFIEGTLEIERPNFQGLVKNIFAEYPEGVTELKDADYIPL